MKHSSNFEKMLTHDQKLISGWLNSLQGIYPPKKVSSKSEIQNIALNCVQYFGLGSRDRKRELVYMRFFLSHKIRDLGFSLTEIGKMMNRDHSTAVYAVKQHEIFKNDKQYRLAVSDIEKWLRIRGI